MKIKSSIVVAAAAGSALAPNAQAADMPVKAPTWTPTQTWNWTGLYIGGHLGAAWQKGHTTGAYVEDNGTRHGFDNRTSKTGFIGGGQIGYNWQHGNFVFGLEGDISGLSGKNSLFSGGDGGAYGFSSQIRWLSTVRSRFGLAVGDTMVYATAGVAFGGVKNSFAT